jgi:Tol biopolymer transport system component
LCDCVDSPLAVLSDKRRTLVHRELQYLRAAVFVVIGMVLLSFLASGGVSWAAPGLQGCTVPPCQPSVAPGQPECCLPGIAFTSTRDGNEEIYVMKSDGTSPLRLTNHPAIDRHPAPSPDGKRLAFISNRDDPDPENCGKPGKPNCIFHIYVMNIDGTSLTRLTTSPGQDTYPSWSSDGMHIAFVSNFEDPNRASCDQPNKPACVTQIYVISSQGHGLVRVTSNPPSNPSAANSSPNWSPYPPNDSRIAFVSNRDGNDEIYVVNMAFLLDRDGNETPDVSGLTRLTYNPAHDGHPAWSPDGRQLVFESDRDQHYQLYVMNDDGSGVTRITNTDSMTTPVANKPLDDRYPIWIPGCMERIVFASNRDRGDLAIYTVDPNGNNPTRLTIVQNGATWWDAFPAWSGLPAPLRVLDGACCVPGIAFDSLRDGNEEIYVMRSDGFRLTRLTYNPARDMRPAPSPDGIKIAFQSNRDGPFQLYWMPIAGGPEVRLTDSSGDDMSPVWSNAGKRIAFVSTRDGPNSKLYLLDVGADGQVSREFRLTSNPSTTDDNPFWSPRDDRIAFQSKTGHGNDDIFLVNADGSGLVQLTDDPAIDGHPSISPDGLLMAFESNRGKDGKYQIYVMNMDGSNVKQITTEGENRRPYWCPSCLGRIVFDSNRDGGGFRIYTMSGDGSNQVRLTTLTDGLSKPDENPAWSGLPLPQLSPIVPATPTR